MADGGSDGFGRGLEAEKIVSAITRDGKEMYNIKWKNLDDLEVVSGDRAREKCPELVKKFVEKKTGKKREKQSNTNQ